MPDASMPLPGRLSEAFQAALDAFEEARAEVAILGGIAVILYGVPRLTMDMDVIARVSRVAWPSLLDSLETRLFTYARPGGEPRAQKDALDQLALDSMTEMWRDGFRLDLLQVSDPLHAEAIAARRVVEFHSRSVPVVRPEHLILTKWIAGRPKDLLDIDGVLAAQGARLDLRLIRAWLPAIETSGGLAASEFEARASRWIGGGK